MISVHRTHLKPASLKHCLLTLLGAALLSACSGGGDQDTIRIGSGQSGSTGTTDAADFPIFYVKRITPDFTDPNTDDDLRRVRVFSTNADLYMRDRASPSAAETNITARVHPANERWDVKDVDVSADGTKVVFAMRGPLDDNQEDEDPPTWNIWEYVIASDTLRRVIVSSVIAEEGQDVSPHYLPDGQILFASTRQRQSKAILPDEYKPQFEAQDENRDESAFVLHVMNADGANIQQVTFNQSHDLDPTILADGRVMFSRWDHAPGRNGVHLYTANPDGTGSQLLYGSASHFTIPDTDINDDTAYPAVQFTKPREMMDGTVLTLVRPFNGTEYGGDLYILDTSNFVENDQATLTGSGTAQSKATPNAVRLINVPSTGGRFVSAVPLWDGTGRLLVSWTQCRVIDPTTNAPVNCTTERLNDPAFVAAQPIYSAWMFNPANGTQQPVVPPVEGVMVTDLAIAQPRSAPAFRPYSLSSNLSLNQTWRGEGVGLLDIRSVYDFDGVAAQTGTGCSIAANADPSPSSTCYANRPARFLRIEKAVSLPDDDVRDIDNNAFGATNFMREILGYIPVEPDGSVVAKIPGNVAFQISITDVNGRRVAAFPRHNAWLTIRPGETVQCNGCHANSTNVPEGQSGRSHGRSGLFNSVYGGASSSAFANANAAFAATSGQTMAQARYNWSCAYDGCNSIKPSVDIVFSNVWPSTTTDSKVTPTNPPRAGDFALRYSSLTTRKPTLDICMTTWFYNCRITINYLEHIQPLWERQLTQTANNVIVPLDLNNDGTADDSCQTCHSRTGTNGPQIPASQLELDNIPADNEGDQGNDNNLRIKSYQDLLFTSKTLTFNTVLEFVCLAPVLDANGVPVPGQCATFDTVSPSLRARDAANSRFFNVFASGGSHEGWLTDGELRLISEWVDIGAQYYNDPFQAPEN